MNRVTDAMAAAFKNYYTNRGSEGWDKQGDIEAIFAACPKKEDSELFVTYLEASAGTFLLWWSDKSQTLHNSKQYQTGVLFSRTIGDAVHIYTDICGDPLETPTIHKKSA